MPAERSDFLCNALYDVRRRRLAGNVRQERETHAAYSRLMHAAKPVYRHIFIHAHHSRCPALHMLERIDNDAVVGAVACRLNDDESQKPILSNEDFSVPPRLPERADTSPRSQRELIERADDVHVGVDGALREFESQWRGVWILSNVWFCAHVSVAGGIRDKSGPDRSLRMRIENWELSIGQI